LIRLATIVVLLKLIITFCSYVTCSANLDYPHQSSPCSPS
jgi:hypothetical protein